MTSPPTARPPDERPPAKGAHPVVWVAAGCAAMLFLVVVAMVAASFFLFKKVQDVTAEFRDNPAMAAAALLVRANPELELLDQDEDNQTLTVLDKASGQRVTVDVEQVQRGRLRISTPEGEIDLHAGTGDSSQLPSWIPRPPGASIEGAYGATSGDQRAGGFTITAGQGTDLFEFYRSQLESAGFTTQIRMEQAESGRILIATSPDQRRGVSAIVAGPQAIITYTENP